MSAKFLPPLPKLIQDCVKCAKSGRCYACRGTVRATAFLRVPSVTAPSCSWCKGSTKCSSCNGLGFVVHGGQSPDIYVQSTLPPATGMMSGMFRQAITHIGIPSRVLVRDVDAQRGWIAWRVQSHFRERNGSLMSRGDILGYIWYPVPNVGIEFDVRGRVNWKRYRLFFDSLEGN